MQQHGLNMMSFWVVLGGQQWFLFGCYLAPNDTDTIKRVINDIGKRHHWAVLMVTGGFNTYIMMPEGSSRREDIAAAGMEVMLAYFLLCRKILGTRQEDMVHALPS